MPVFTTLSLHDLRRSGITTWSRRANIQTVSRMAGHNDIDTTMRYYAAITEENGWIHYTPQLGNSRADSFTYTIRNSQGGITTLTVLVGVIPENAPVQQAKTNQLLPDGSRRVTFTGVPGRIYRIHGLFI